jgi:hypothetical protein
LKGFAQSFSEAFDAKGFARAFRAAIDLGNAGRSFAAGFRDGVALLWQKTTGEGGMEPISAIALSLALGAGATAGKAVVNELVKDAYAALKGLIKRRYPTVSVEQLEQAPQSKNRRAVVEEDLANSDAGKDGELIDAANRLIELVRQQAPGAAAAIGVELKDVEAANLRLRDITASGTGVKVERGRFGGDIDISNVRAGVKRDDPATGE